MKTIDYKKRILKVLLLCPIFLFAASSALFAEEDERAEKSKFKIGFFEVHPSISAKELYNSNIFSEADGSGENPDYDWITIFTPGINFKYPGKRLKIKLDYAADIERYSRFNNENTEKHRASARMNFITASKKVEYEFSNSYLDTKDAPSSDAQSNSDLNRADRILNSLLGSAKVKFGKNIQITFDGLSEYGKYDLAALDSENTTKNKLGLAMYYKFMPKTSATVNYHYGMIDYRDALTSENSDSKSHRVRAGIAIDATAKLSGEATFGYERRDYKEDAFADGDTESAEVKLHWIPQQRTTLDIIASRSLEESSFGTNSASFTRNSIIIKLDHKFTKKIRTKITGGIGDSDYPGRKDNEVQFGLDLNYKIREWLFITPNYSYKNNNSDVNDRDYKIHKMFLNVGATF